MAFTCLILLPKEWLMMMDRNEVWFHVGTPGDHLASRLGVCKLSSKKRRGCHLAVSRLRAGRLVPLQAVKCQVT